MLLWSVLLFMCSIFFIVFGQLFMYVVVEMLWGIIGSKSSFYKIDI